MPTNQLTKIQKAELFNKLLHTLGDFDKSNNLLLTTNQVEEIVSDFRIFLNQYISEYSKKTVEERGPNEGC